MSGTIYWGQVVRASGISLYGYDTLDRLISETSAAVGSLAYSYDPNGNRLSFLDNGETKSYGYSPNSNRLTQIGHKDVVLDAAGNVVSKDNGKWRYEYGQSGKLLKVYKERKPVATYLYNAQGQRTQKITKRGATIYHYDLAGHLIAETNKAGNLIRAYVWLDNLPLVQIDVKGHHDDKGKDKRRNKTKEHIAYLHTDHLGTPRLATDANQQVVWRWESDAFGAKKPEDLDGDEGEDNHNNKITVNLGSEGTYRDRETHLTYNGARYVDKHGRFLTADPISVAAHVQRRQASLGAPSQPPLELNPFVRVANNPLRWVDPTGESATGTLEWCLANPRACGGAIAGASSAAGASILGGIGAMLYSPTACPTDEEEEDCVEQWRRAYEICAEQQKRGGGRGITGGHRDEYQCAKGLVSQKCGGNKVQ